MKQKKTDPALGQRLYDGLLGGIPELKDKRELIVVPDGNLHLLPFSALVNAGQYLLISHLVTVAPSGRGSLHQTGKGLQVSIVSIRH